MAVSDKLDGVFMAVSDKLDRVFMAVSDRQDRAVFSPCRCWYWYARLSTVG